MAKQKNRGEWPPEDGQEFIRSEQFSQLLLETVEHLTQRYPRMDFSTGVAAVFEWFDGKLQDEPDFINTSRFASISALRAYVRQAVWREALRSARDASRRHESIDHLTLEHSLMASMIDPSDLAAYHECVERLTGIHREVYDLMTGDTDPLVETGRGRSADVAEALDRDPPEVHEIFDQAVSQVAECPGFGA